FGHLEMYEGIDFIVAIVGLFAISELLLFLENTHAGENVRVSVGKVSANLKESLATGWAMLRGSVVGFIAGVLPGAGASLGVFSRIPSRNATPTRTTPSARATRAAWPHPRPATTRPPAAPWSPCSRW